MFTPQASFWFCRSNLLRKVYGISSSSSSGSSSSSSGSVVGVVVVVVAVISYSSIWNTLHGIFLIIWVCSYEWHDCSLNLNCTETLASHGTVVDGHAE